MVEPCLKWVESVLSVEFQVVAVYVQPLIFSPSGSPTQVAPLSFPPLQDVVLALPTYFLTSSIGSRSQAVNPSQPSPARDPPLLLCPGDARRGHFVKLPSTKMETSAIVKTIVPPTLVTAILLIFGGCCSNVYTLESITHQVPNTGTLITFAQFLAVAVGGYIQFSVTSSGRQAIWQHKVPMVEYCKIVGFHFSVSILNNMALDYHISVPVHIILRSGGSVVTMLLAFIFYGRRYTPRQISAVLLVTVGIIISTVSGRSSSSVSTEATENDSRFLVGVGISKTS